MGEDFDLFTNIEYIAKDIQEQENKVIAMEFTKNIGYLLIENGVRMKITEYTKEIDENNSIESTFESRYGISIDGLDFTEHDKVFEDKIAELENIINNKLGGWDKHGITYQEILDMKAENDLLKQRISELESKKTEKPTKYITVIVAKEINGQEYVRLEDFMSVVNDLQAQIGT